MSGVKYDDRFPLHPKLVVFGQQAPLVHSMHLRMTCWCSMYLTDGLIPWEVAEGLCAMPGLYVTGSDGTPQPVDTHGLLVRMITEHLLEDLGDSLAVHDYLDYNPSREEVVAKKTARASAGRLGGVRSGAARRGEAIASGRRSKIEANASMAVENPEIEAGATFSAGVPVGGRHIEANASGDEANASGGRSKIEANASMAVENPEIEANASANASKPVENSVENPEIEANASGDEANASGGGKVVSPPHPPHVCFGFGYIHDPTNQEVPDHENTCSDDKKNAAEKIESTAGTLGSKPRGHPGFEEFWGAWPKRCQRRDRRLAMQAWQRVKPPLAAVLAALAWQDQQSEWTKDGGMYIPSPVTWLTQRRWERERPVGARDTRSGVGINAAVHEALDGATHVEVSVRDFLKSKRGSSGAI